MPESKNGRNITNHMYIILKIYTIYVYCASFPLSGFQLTNIGHISLRESVWSSKLAAEESKLLTRQLQEAQDARRSQERQAVPGWVGFFETWIDDASMSVVFFFQ